jgi:homoserine O-acetyltransferase/O-succinyltransferase
MKWVAEAGLVRGAGPAAAQRATAGETSAIGGTTSRAPSAAEFPAAAVLPSPDAGHVSGASATHRNSGGRDPSVVSDADFGARDGPASRSLRGVKTQPDPEAGRIVSRWLGRFTLESGAVLPDLVVAYRHDGVPVGEGRQILVVHALTGSADAAGDWWAPIIGPGQVLDTDKYGVICANLLGSRYGTSGPTSRNAVTGKPYGRAFPRVTVRDQARAQWRLLDALGITKLAVSVGGSLGGMVAQEVALERPGDVSRVVSIAAPSRIGQLAIGWNHIQLDVIEKLGVEGLEIARQLAMTTYRSEVDFELRFAGRVEPDGTPAIVSYLRHQGGKLLERFDPDTYRALVLAMDTHDIGRSRGGVVAALHKLAVYGTQLTGVGIEGDILYGTNQVQAMVDDARAAGLDAAYREIHSTKGHDAFLVEWAQLEAVLGEALK